MIRRILNRVARRLVQATEPRPPSNGLNLLGDRDVEWSWVSAHIPNGPGELLDFGPGGSYLGLTGVHRGFNVTALDLLPINWPYVHPRLKGIQGDILEQDFNSNRFDVILNCSVIEHVGLAGRYGVTRNQSDGDLRAMHRLWELMKPGGLMLLTLPVGVDAVFAPLHRVYGTERLFQLIKDFSVEHEEYWAKDPHNRWNPVSRKEALAFKPQERLYALGAMRLRKAV